MFNIHIQLFFVKKRFSINNSFFTENKEKGSGGGRRSGVVSGRGAVCWFCGFRTFPRVSAFGSGFGSGDFAPSRIETILNEIKKKVAETKGFRHFYVRSQRCRFYIFRRECEMKFHYVIEMILLYF